MLKIIEKRVAALPMDTPLEQVRAFIDQLLQSSVVKGREPKTIRIGHAHRASV